MKLETVGDLLNEIDAEAAAQTAADPHEAWLAERRTGIGGSDMAAILGLSKWRTPLDVFLDKRGQIGPIPDNEPMLWGRLLEPVVRQEYANRTGREVLLPDHMLRHPDHPFLLANLDGYTPDNRVVEIKTARRADGWGEPGTDEVPQHYLLQVQHYLAITGFAVADVAVLIGGSDFRLYEVPADAELHAMMIDAAATFWARVQANEPPEPISYADAMAAFGSRSKPGATALADRTTVDAIERLRDLNAQIKTLGAKANDAKATILNTMGEAETLLDDGGNTLATWKMAKPARRFDAAAFREANPEIYTKFTKLSAPSRRFLLK